jgi:signal transduction histidine kinase
MEGTPVRRPQRLPVPTSLIELVEAEDVSSLQTKLESLLSEQLKNNQIIVAVSDPMLQGLQVDGQQSWLKSFLEKQPTLVTKLSEGELVGISASELSIPHPIASARSNVLLIPIVLEMSLNGLIAVITRVDGIQPSLEEIEFVRAAAHLAAPLIERFRQIEGLLKENEALSGIVQMRAHFQANVAHELRTPLAAIRGYSRMILDGRAGEVNTTQREYLTVVTENTNRMIHLVNWMSHVLDRSAQTFKLSTFDYAEVWSESLSKHQPLLREKQITIKTQIPNESFMMTGDREKLTAVFDTLLKSAAKFAKSSGEVPVQFSHGREHDVTVKVTIAGDGIPQEILKTIFDRPINAGLDSSVDREIAELDFPGVHDVIGMHGGRLFVNSKPGEGSTFIFTLPAVVKDGEEKLSHEQTVNSGRRRR